MIASAITAQTLNTLFTEITSSRLTYVSNKALEIKTYILFSLVFASNTFLLCFFFFSLIIDLYVLIPVIVAQIFNPTAGLGIPLGMPNKEAKAEI